MKWRSTALATTAVLWAARSCSALAGAGVEGLATTLVAQGLENPTFVGHAPGDFEHLYVLEQPGRVRVLNLVSGVLADTPFLDIQPLVLSGDERGLLGLAFHPDYEDNGYFYLNYTAVDEGATTVRRYTAIDAETADDASGITLLTISQPRENHNGGWMGFGPNDGYLYIATGDGGENHRAQDITDEVLGKILRIDVNGDDAGNYGIPLDNPFVGIDGDDEIWAYGLRNPWRCSFDRETGDLWIADVGQNIWEEVNFQPTDSTGGENYGWPCREGRHDYRFQGDCINQTLVEPVYEYPHDIGRSITGGYAYQGCAIPTLRGFYLFADYYPDHIWIGVLDGEDLLVEERQDELNPSIEDVPVVYISSFGEDALGEIYIASHSSGRVFRIIPEMPTIRDGDLNCDGSVSVEDLLRLLAAWGPCPGCREDIDGNGTVEVADVLILLAQWG